MRVGYISKALEVAAYRAKIRALGQLAEVVAVAPERWGRRPPESSSGSTPEPRWVRVRWHGHNHLHHYPGAGRWLDELDPDLVHIDEEPYSLVTWQIGRLCQRQGTPFLFFAWQNLDRRLPPPFGVLRRWVFRHAGAGIAGTPASADVLRSAGFGGPLAVIPQFGVDPDRFAPDPEARARSRLGLGLPESAFVVGYGGRLVPEKGVGALVEAFARLNTGTRVLEGPYLVVAGDGPERDRLQRTARAGGVRDRVRMLGHVHSLDMPETLLACDVVVLPSIGTRTWTEQFGRILVEAMACEVPVIGARCGEIPSVIGDAGVVVPPGDPAALAAALESLRANPDRRARLGESGRTRVRDRYTHERVAQDTAELYRRVARRGAAA